MPATFEHSQVIEGAAWGATESTLRYEFTGNEAFVGRFFDYLRRVNSRERRIGSEELFISVGAPDMRTFVLVTYELEQHGVICREVYLRPKNGLPHQGPFKSILDVPAEIDGANEGTRYTVLVEDLSLEYLLPPHRTSPSKVKV